MSAFDLGVIFGRFQPFHAGHMMAVRDALQDATAVAVVVGSVNEPRSHRNPWTFEERKEMILASFPDNIHERLIVIPIEDDQYNDARWIAAVQSAIDQITTPASRIALIGPREAETGYYTSKFPDWYQLEVARFQNVTGDRIRQPYFSNIGHQFLAGSAVEHTSHLADILMSHGVHGFLSRFIDTPDYKLIREEYEFTTTYRSGWVSAPYPPTFVTVDAVVEQSGHVLLVKRLGRPGKGLWALPGGFVQQEERLLDAMLRELREETGLKVPAPVLSGNITEQRVFDDPWRSSRGRTITQAFLIALQPLPMAPGERRRLPMIRGGSDAENAKWWPLARVKRSMMFEDHFSILRAFNLI